MNRMREYQVSGKNSDDSEIRAKLVHLTRYHAVMEIHDLDLVLRVSQVISDFKISFDAATIYLGRGVVGSIINAGNHFVCDVRLADEGFQLGVSMLEEGGGIAASEFREFLDHWQRNYRIATEYKIVVGDMFSFLDDLRYWMNQIELGLGKKGVAALENQGAGLVKDVARKVIPIIDDFFARFEEVAESLPLEAQPLHGSFMRRQLHPLVLCAPFAHRTYTKPLGYAGDYEMINMIARRGSEGASLFAKVLNRWFVEQPPALAHRNRLCYLAGRITDEALRGVREGRRTKIFNLACGPAWEVQGVLSQPERAPNTEFTLLDFNEETLAYTQGVLSGIQKRNPGNNQVGYIKKSVHQLLMESGRGRESDRHAKYDFVYCAGLFDYLSDQVCHRLLNLMYDWVAPGGLVLATNVEPSNPLRHGMDHLLEWHLNYRSAIEFRRLAPKRAQPDDVRVFSDETGVNVFLEVRKPYGG